nr:hypothetical protein BaRGS_026281 [Batillaria attramentaria]
MVSYAAGKGTRQGDVVCNTLPNSPERLLTDLGIMLAGGVAMNGQVFLADGADFINCKMGENGKKPFLEELQKEQELFVADVKPTDPAFIFTTSGSTGFSTLVIKSEACTGMLLVPLHIDMTLARPELWKDLTTKPRIAVTGGQPVKKQHTDIVGKLADSLVILYGSTEAGDDDDDDDDDQVKLVDENSHEVLKAGQAGEVLVRGPTVFTGYFGTREDVDQEQTNVFTADGFFRTSDVAFRGPSGGIHVVCRQSNAIIHGAFIVYPGWLESRIERCPGVQSVIIVPVPDRTLHQELCACVVPQAGATLTADDVRDFCKSLFLVSDTSEMSQVPR